MENDIRELDLEELELVSGGRGMYESEDQDYNKMRSALADKYWQMRNEGRKEEASAMYKRFKESYFTWMKAIENAEDRSPAIPFSKYFQF